MSLELLNAATSRQEVSLELLAARTPQRLRKPKKRRVRLVADARVGGLMCWAPSGWGKSVLLGAIAHQDALAGVGFVVIDTIGSTIDAALSHLLREPRKRQLALLKKTRYCRMSGEKVGQDTYVPAFPMLAPRFHDEHVFTTGHRPLELIRKTDRNLETASIQGFNRLSPLLVSIAMVLTALNEPLSRAYDLLEGSLEWHNRLTNLAFENREVRDACLFLLHFLSLAPREQEIRSEVFRNKFFLPLKLDTVSQAMFCAKEPLIDWEEVASNGCPCYIDLRGNEPESLKELKLFWVWNSLMEYVKSREEQAREKPPLGIILDEVSYLVRSPALNSDVIIEELRELCQVRKRNANAWLTAATQEQKEIPEKLRTALLSMNSQLMGATIEQETAIQNAWRWDYRDLDPYKVKYWQRVWASETHGGGFGQPSYTSHFVIDHTPVFMSLEEQIFEASRKYRSLEKGRWLASLSSGEGVLPNSLRHISTSRLNESMRFDTRLVRKLKRYLSKRDGVKVSDIVTALQEHNGFETLPPLENPANSVAEMNGNQETLPIRARPTEHGNGSGRLTESPMRRRKRTL